MFGNAERARQEGATTHENEPEAEETEAQKNRRANELLLVDRLVVVSVTSVAVADLAHEQDRRETAALHLAEAYHGFVDLEVSIYTAEAEKRAIELEVILTPKPAP